MNFKQSLITILQFNRVTSEEVGDISVALASGLITETEFLKKLIDLANRSNSVPKEALEKMAQESFPYSVATGSYDDDGENCKYCDDFASMRDAITAWEEYSPGAAWARIEFTCDGFTYGLDPYKIRKAKRVKMDDGETRTMYMRCNERGEFIDQ